MNGFLQGLVPSLLLLGAASALSCGCEDSGGEQRKVRPDARRTSRGGGRSVDAERSRGVSRGSVRLADAWPAVIRLAVPRNGAGDGEMRAPGSWGSRRRGGVVPEHAIEASDR